MTKLHLKTQRGQPYGSVRRCCERCGVMIWPSPPSGEAWTDLETVFNNPPGRFFRCDESPLEGLV